MCKQCYEKILERSGKIMLFCKLKEKEQTNNQIMNLCICQRFCTDKNKYIPYQQKEGCKYYDD